MKRSHSSSTTLPKWAKYHPYSPSLTRPSTDSSLNASSSSQRRSTKTNTISTSETASATIQKIQNEHRAQIQKDEFELRSKAFHFTCSNIVQNAFDDMLCDHLREKLLDPLCNFMNHFQPCVDVDIDYDGGKKEASSSTKRRRVDTLDDSHNDNIQKSLDELFNQIQYHHSKHKKKYEPTLLPIGIIHVQPSILDRNVIIQSLKQQIMMSLQKHEEKETNDQHTLDQRSYIPAVCILNEMDMSNDSNTTYHRLFKKNRVEYYLYSILAQCIQQESNSSQYSDLLQSTSSSIATIDKILLWAQSTTQFNSVLILIENPELFSHSAMNIFMSILSTMRCIHGIPVGIVFFSMSQELIQNELISSHISSSSLNGEVGVVVNEFDSIPSNVLVDGLIERLFCNKRTSLNLPIIPSRQVMDKLLFEFKINHRSVVCFMSQLKMALAHHFTLPGSFLSLIYDKKFMNKFDKHLTWFMVDYHSRKRITTKMQDRSLLRDNSVQQPIHYENSKEMLDSISVVFGQRFLVSLIANMLSVAHEHLFFKNKVHSTFQDKHINMIEAFLTKSNHYRQVLEKLFDFIRSSSIKDVTLFIGKLIEVSKEHIARIDVKQSNATCGIPKDITDLLSFLQSSIILFDRVTKEFEWDLREWTVEELSKIFSHQNSCDTGGLIQPVSHSVFYGSNERIESFVSSICTMPRHDMATAIGNPDVDNADGLSLDLKTTFNVFDSRVIEVEEWFRRFIDNHTGKGSEEESTSDLLQRFAFSVYQLILCGLVVRSHRSENIFEKAALVWATAK